MSDPASTTADLEGRVRRLEALYGVIDLLALPGMLAGGAARIFDSRHTADTLPDRAIGFYPKESAGRGLAIRWTRHPDAGELAIPALQGFPFRIELAVLPMPHIAKGEDVVLVIDGERVALGEPSMVGPALVFAAEFIAPRTGLTVACVKSREPLRAAGADTRQLGLPFVSLHSSPSGTILAAAR